MPRILLLTSMALVMSGCAVQAPYWYRPGATEAQFEAAASNCDGAADTRFPPVTMGKPGYFAAPNEWCAATPGGTNCMIIGAGYLPQARSSADTNEWPRANAFNSCMIAGGWRPAGPEADEAVVPPSGARAGAVDQALTDCEALFKGTASSSSTRPAQFHQCVVNRARELSGSRPPA
jgi:hypothetical protein